MLPNSRTRESHFFARREVRVMWVMGREGRGRRKLELRVWMILRKRRHWWPFMGRRNLVLRVWMVLRNRRQWLLINRRILRNISRLIIHR